MINQRNDIQRTRARRGFTLVELMVVVSIIAVLSAIAVVGYSKYLDSARETEGETFLASVKTKQEAYRQRFGAYATADANPANRPAPRDKKDWDENQLDWVQLGAQPGAEKVGWQYRTASGTGGESACSSNVPDGLTAANVCSGVGNVWYWAVARNTQKALITNSAKNRIWSVETNN